MKRAVTILFFTALLHPFGFAQGLQTINGEVRYQYQYQDYSTDGSHVTVSTHNPMLNLRSSGSVVDPTVLLFDLRTFFSLNNSIANSAQNSFINNQFSWNYYTLGLNFFKTMPVGTTLSLSDGITRTSSHSTQFDQEPRELRRQQQSLRMMTHTIPFLPSMTFSIDRSHQWSLNPDSPVDQSGTSYSMNMASGGHGGYVNVSGSMSENSERYTGSYIKTYAATVNGTRNIADLQTLNYDINYNRFGEITNLSGLASYSNYTSKEFRFNTVLNSRFSGGKTDQSRFSNLSQSIQYLQNENLRYGFSIGGGYGRTQYSDGRSAIDNSVLNSGLSAQHTRNFDAFGISNGLSFGYGVSNYLDRQQSYSAGFSNGVRTHAGSFDMSAGQTFSYGNLKNHVKRDWVSNGLNLNIEGIALYDFRTQLIVEYQSDVYAGDLQGFGNQKQIHMQWAAGSPPMRFIVPFTVAASGGISWLLEGEIGRTYNWEGSFISNEFFTPNLSFTYRMSRVFDASVNRPSITHSVDMQYQLRAIALSLRYQNYQLLSTQNLLWLTMSRPF